MSIPIKFKELSLRNFLSFGNNTTTISIAESLSTLILGLNVDNNNGANGCGKSTIINALCYSLYNKPMDNSISLQKLINSTNNSKNTLMEVRLILEKGNDELEIYRCRGESFTIQLLLNGKDVTFDSVSENDKFIAEFIGLSYDLFTKIVIFSGSSSPFLLLPVSQQRQQIEELFKITLLTEKAVKLKEKIKSTEHAISIQIAVLKERENQIQLFNSHLNNAKLRVTKWDTDREQNLSKLRDQISLIAEVDIEEEKRLQKKLSEFKKNKIDLSSEIINLNKDIKVADLELAKLSAELVHLKDDKCPYCLQQFADSEDIVNKLNIKIQDLKSKSELLLPILNAKNIEIDSINSNITDIESKIVFSSLEDVIKTENSVLTANEKISEIENSINPHVESLEQLKLTVIDKLDTDKLDLLKKELEHQQFLLKLLTDKNSFIRRKIISKTIPFLNTRIIAYTKALGLPHIVKFDDNMTCLVSEFGRELDFGNLSGGEKKRVNLSLSLAFRDVLHHLHAKINCLFIDEIDASLDTSGVDNVFKLLKQKTRDDNIGLWVISHRPEALGRFDRQLTIKKEHGFSTILENADY